MKFKRVALCLILSTAFPAAAYAGNSVLYTSPTATYDDYVKDRDTCMSGAQTDAASVVNSMGAYTPNAAAMIGAAIGRGIVEGGKIREFYTTCMTGKGYTAQPITKQEALRLQARDMAAVQNHEAEKIWNTHVVKPAAQPATQAASAGDSAAYATSTDAASSASQ